ncbi:CapA family protein [Thermoflavimicrobium dichotomicum]|uniref:Poly-gamma-glutamate synthesis protein (Capsule biosynthesis protein) n=1 Tax=Thermoflavimicrobium dichotomicum TaxID=46223 RepID=A0A1I3RZN3_9BACL|nr:CapA family protein [Thermoflavimicrobium dichotomicum]SFJ50751.1 poly-gamma-glutamate synthesis protein (capsule biosynthesis protein) [Thermoflavimicrobium dichotomicum]
MVLTLVAWFFDFFGLFQTKPVKQEPKTSPKQTGPSRVQIAAFGDIMMHDWQIKDGEKEDGSYDFHQFFTKIKPYLTSPDLAVGNLEFTLRGKKPYTGYPHFNAPDEIVDALKDAGVDVVSTANNHAMDTGAAGVKRTYKVVNEKGIKTAGTAPSAEQRKPTIVEKNGIRFAFLAYTETTNGIPVPEDYLVNRIDLKQIRKDIQEAKKQGAEFVAVSLHFGEEYQRKPNEYQRKVANQVLKDGADVILGNHPHVLQRVEKVKMDGKEKLIIYSMGNFISYQVKEHTDESAIIYFDVVKDPAAKKVQITHVSFLPIYTYKKGYHVEVVPMPSETPASLDGYEGLTEKKWKNAYENIVEVINEKQNFPIYEKK